MDKRGSFVHKSTFMCTKSTKHLIFSACSLNTFLFLFESYQKRVQPVQSGHPQESASEEMDTMSKSINMLLREQENGRPDQ